MTASEEVNSDLQKPREIFEQISTVDGIANLKKKANKDVSAQYLIGMAYDWGNLANFPSPISYGLAFAYYQLAANQGHRSSQALIGYFYEHGLGTFQSFEKAIVYYEKAAAAGDSEAMLRLGNLYDKITRSYDNAAAKSDLQTLCKLQMDYPKAFSHPNAQEYYSKALEKLKEDTIRNNFEIGNNIYKKLEIKDSKLPSEAFSNHFAWGYVLEKRFRYHELVFLYYKAKAMLGDVTAVNKVIECYKNEIGVTKDDEQISKYMTLLTNKMLEKAEKALVDNPSDENIKNFITLQKTANSRADDNLRLAWCYKEGIGVEPSLQLFQHYLEEKANQQDQGPSVYDDIANALYALGWCYDFAEGGYPCDPNKAAEYYLKAADRGHAAAQYCIGTFFEHGIGIRKSLGQALDFYKLAALKNHIFALCKLGWCYEHGISAKKSMDTAYHYYKLCSQCSFDEEKANKRIKYASTMNSQETLRLYRCYEEAFLCYRALAENGNIHSMIKLADYYRLGHGIRRLGIPAYGSIENAQKSYFLAAEQFHPQALRWTGYYFEREGKFDQAFKYYQQAADLEDTCAYGLLAQCYEEGKGVSKSLEDAHYYYEMCAQGNWELEELEENSIPWGHIQRFVYNKARAAIGVTEALYEVAKSYKEGDGVIQSDVHEQHFLKLAQNNKETDYFESQRSLESQQSLRQLCSDDSIPIEKKIAILENCAQKGDNEAFYQLALCYQKGQGLEQSNEQYIKFLKLAAEQGHIEALFILGDYFDYGSHGLPFSYEEAAKCFHIVAEKGSGQMQAIAQVRLGYFYENCLGVLHSDKKAVDYYLKSAKQSNSYALWLAAQCYEEGKGVAYSHNKSERCYREGLRCNDYSEKDAEQDIASGNEYLLKDNEESGIKGYAEKSFRHFQRAFLFYKAKACIGDVASIMKVAECYENGCGVKYNETKAEKYLNMLKQNEG